jgi:hypothetical protein
MKQVQNSPEYREVFKTVWGFTVCDSNGLLAPTWYRFEQDMEAWEVGQLNGGN